ncbi:MAG: NAD(P)H-hydrate dehydratase [Planctomycetaceae bacterium]|nr:NAD(P)H-hydrate dehydratase [Planctomycetaceae bacterium]
MVIERVSELPTIPDRPADGHKGTFGRVLILAGSRGMSGAAALAGLGALRGGAGLVYVATPREIIPIVASIEPSYLTVPLPEDGPTGRIGMGAQPEIETAATQVDVVALGPGLGRSPEIVQLVGNLVFTLERPLVVDADALNALAARGHAFASRSFPEPRILTPHPGEFARLSGHAIETIQANREELAAEFAEEHGVVLVLKGQGTVVTDGRRVAVNGTGNSGLATGGSGDVLTGLIAALLAQGMDAFEAAQLGTHLHGLAGDLTAAEQSQRGLIASDLPDALGRAWRQTEAEIGKS